MSTQEQNTEPTVTPLEEWNKEPEEGFIIQLPQSQHYVRVRRTLDMMVMLRTGLIPNPLGRIVREMMATGKNDLDLTEIDDKALDQMMELTDSIVASCMLEPKVSAPEKRQPGESDEVYAARLQNFQPAPNTLSVYKIPLVDRQYIAAVAQGRATDLESFREESDALVADLQAGQGVVRTPEQPPRAVRRAAAKKKQPT
jgi:hypothetical protein